jgi:hypothetical protein
MNCQNCNFKLKENQNICTNCGESLNDIVLTKDEFSPQLIPNYDFFSKDDSIISNKNANTIIENETSESSKSSEFILGIIFGLISVIVNFGFKLIEHGFFSLFAGILGGGFVMVGIPFFISAIIKIFNKKTRFSLIFMSVSLILNIFYILMILNKPPNPYE